LYNKLQILAILLALLTIIVAILLLRPSGLVPNVSTVEA
jgi:ABC-type transport system involved in cytochrome bd biosynthesis fused ATPase/permease subunit